MVERQNLTTMHGGIMFHTRTGGGPPTWFTLDPDALSGGISVIPMRLHKLRETWR